jgi:uncharacterized protein
MGDVATTAKRLKGARGESSCLSSPYRPNSWSVAFVQDCNLRCGYCCTGYGRFRDTAAVMQPETWGQLVDRILQMSDGCPKIHIDFSTGETFLHFDQAMAFLDRLRELAAPRNTAITVQIITNGTLATKEQLQACLERRITLCFSIDGPAPLHDRFRRSSNGEPTHHLAIANWRRYREMVRSIPDGPGCNLYSVIADGTSLNDVAAFWRQQGARRFKAIPADPDKRARAINTCGWQARRAGFLADLDKLASEESIRLRGRSLAGEAEGPSALVDVWRKLEQAEAYAPCGAGYTTIGVDAAGDLYPCQGFLGFTQHAIGSVKLGLDIAKVSSLRAARAAAQRRCNGCWMRFLCSEGCCASDPRTGVVIDAWGECEFQESFIEIGIRTFQSWRDGASAEPGAGTP